MKTICVYYQFGYHHMPLPLGPPQSVLVADKRKNLQGKKHFWGHFGVLHDIQFLRHIGFSPGFRGNFRHFGILKGHRWFVFGLLVTTDRQLF